MNRRLSIVFMGILAATAVLRFAYAVVVGTVQLEVMQWFGFALLLSCSGWLAVVVSKWERREKPTKLALIEMVNAAALAAFGYTFAVMEPSDQAGRIRFGLAMVVFAATSLRRRMESAPLHDDTDSARPA